VSIRFLSASEWRLLQSARLDALSESPASFLSTFAEERQYGQQRWKAELDRGAWLVGTRDDAAQPQALLGATWGADIPVDDRYLSYLWVAPPARGRGLGRTLVTRMLAHLREWEVPRVWLWVLDGNDTAHQLYRKVGFESTGLRKPLSRDPSRIEERLLLELSRPNAEVRQPQAVERRLQ
jgi:ribosomal protein S18 acetylase RimI-like enzyme